MRPADTAVGESSIARHVQFNARSETVAEKSVFNRLLGAHRCVVPVNGFYEWKKVRPILPPEFSGCSKSRWPLAEPSFIISAHAHLQSCDSLIPKILDFLLKFKFNSDHPVFLSLKAARTS